MNYAIVAVSPNGGTDFLYKEGDRWVGGMRDDFKRFPTWQDAERFIVENAIRVEGRRIEVQAIG